MAECGAGAPAGAGEEEEEEEEEERVCTGLSASAMGPRAVAGGECTKGNHQENH
jgi:hypothetical protein